MILSNAMNSQIMSNVEKLGAPFHAVFTAEQTGSYKPRMNGFEYMLDALGCGPEDITHVSSSFRYDLMTAYDLGIKSKVWVNRRHEPANPYYEYTEIKDIGGLAGRARARGRAAAGMKLEALLGSTPRPLRAGPSGAARRASRRPSFRRRVEGDSRPFRPGLNSCPRQPTTRRSTASTCHRRELMSLLQTIDPCPPRHAGSGQARARPADRRRSRAFLTWALDASRDGEVKTGIWQATPGETVSIKGELFEFCHILEGVIELTEEGRDTGHLPQGRQLHHEARLPRRLEDHRDSAQDLRHRRLIARPAPPD